MVKLFLSFAAMATVVASVVTAAPFSRRPFKSGFSSRWGPNKCIPETSIKEYHPFELESFKLQSFVSKMMDDNLLVGGVNGNKNFQQLQFCIVSADMECNPSMPSNCIYQNVEYRFRVNGPVKGYLRVVGNEVEIVDNFNHASGLNLYKQEGWGLRVAHLRPDGSREVFATNGGGNPITLEQQRTNDARQWFEIMEPEYSASKEPNQCIPETNIKEYNPFELKSTKLDSLVSRMMESPFLVGGINGNKNFQQLQFCIVSTDMPCATDIPTNCIYENVEYRFRINGPMEGYLRVEGNRVMIVDNYYAASGLNLYKEQGWGLRVAHLRYDGSREVFATNGAGNPITLEQQHTNDARQWFEIMEPMY